MVLSISIFEWLALVVCVCVLVYSKPIIIYLDCFKNKMKIFIHFIQHTQLLSLSISTLGQSPHTRWKFLRDYFHFGHPVMPHLFTRNVYFFSCQKNIIIIIIIIWTSIIWMNIFFLYRKKWNFSNFTTTNKQTILLLAQRPSSTSLLDQFATRKKPTEFWSKKFFVFCPFFSHQFRSMSKWHTYKQFDFALNECLDTQTLIHNQSNNNVIFIHP